MVKTADQKRLDEEFYAKFDKLITTDKEVVDKSNRLIGKLIMFIGIEAMCAVCFGSFVDKIPNMDIIKIVLGAINVAIITYMVVFVVKNRESL